MREHKFRTLIDGEWYYWWPTALPKVEYAIAHGAPTVEYTGLKDKNGAGDGVDVYEGDIVERRDGTRGEVIYHAESAGYCLDLHRGDDVPLGSILTWFQVIGNIYENPELLE